MFQRYLSSLSGKGLRPTGAAAAAARARARGGGVPSFSLHTTFIYGTRASAEWLPAPLKIGHSNTMVESAAAVTKQIPRRGANLHFFVKP